MSTESKPSIIIDKYNVSGYYWDASDIATSVNYTYGRNQPFAMAEVVVKKSYFNSAELYWNNAPNVPKENGVAILPTIVDGVTTIFIEAYGAPCDMIIERATSDEDYITFLCYNKAYKLKNQMDMKSLCRIVKIDDGYYFENDTLNPLESNIIGYKIDGGYYFEYDTLNPPEGNIVEYKIELEYKVDTVGDVAQYITFIATEDEQTGAVDVEYISGTGMNIFKFIAIRGLKFEPENCICDPGYTYDYTVIDEDIHDTYTMMEMDAIKNSPKVYSEDIIKLRAQADSCWDIIRGIGYLSNRWAFFHDKAYFVDYDSSAYCDVFDEMQLGYGIDDLTGENLSYYIKSEGGDAHPLDIYEIVNNKDQGSTYVMTGQKVFSENYSASLYISDADKSIVGEEIYFPYPEIYENSTFNNEERNRIVKKLAFNKIIANFKPHDCVEFTISEMHESSRTVTYDEDCIANSVESLPIGVANGTIGLVVNGIFTTYYEYSAIAGWQVFNHEAFSNTRTETFSVYTLIKKLTDTQNNIIMNDVALACIELSWPACVTTLSFGNPQFMDAQNQWSQLENGVATSTSKGTEDAMISDRYASKIVVGNQTLSALADDRNGFTGLIMEKNRDNDLYRLSGYNNGALQAYFNSQGEIMSGNGKVKINEDGITIGAGAGEIDPSITSVKTWSSSKEYASGEIVKWDNIVYISLADENLNNVPGASTNWQQLTYNTSSVQVWVAGTYKDGQTVIYDGMIYESLIDDNTATPGSDDTKWKQLTYDNASIGIWDGDTTYRAGEVIIYNNIMYRSKEDGNTNENPASSTTYWEQLTYEDSSVKTWVQGTYDLGQIVLLNNVTYISTAGGNTSKPGESSTWQQLTYIKTETYNPAVTYSKGQFVLVDNDTYVSLQDGNIGHAPASSPDYWSLLTYSDFYVIEWNTGMACDVGQLVLYGGKTYVATAETTASDKPGVSDKWQQLTYVDTSLKQWVTGTSYREDQMVIYKNLIYQSTEDNNTTEPTTQSSNWTQITKYESTATWDASITYESGQSVVYNGFIYISLQGNNINKSPSSFADYWKQITYGDNRTTIWTTGVEYPLYQLVFYETKTYICIKTPNIGVYPGTDDTCWSLLTYDDIGTSVWNANITYGIGRLVIYDTITYESLAINKNETPGAPGSEEIWKEMPSDVTFWSVFRTYSKDDVVIHNSTLYTAIQGGKAHNPETATGWWKKTVNTTDLSGDIDTSKLSGDIEASKNKVVGGTTTIDGEGLKTFSSTGTLVCKVGTDGVITGVKVISSNILAGELNSDVIYTGTLSADKITAGTLNISGGKVTIGSDGMTVFANLNETDYISSEALKIKSLETTPRDLFRIYTHKGLFDFISESELETSQTIEMEVSAPTLLNPVLRICKNKWSGISELPWMNLLTTQTIYAPQIQPINNSLSISAIDRTDGVPDTILIPLAWGTSDVISQLHTFTYNESELTGNLLETIKLLQNKCNYVGLTSETSTGDASNPQDSLLTNTTSKAIISIKSPSSGTGSSTSVMGCNFKICVDAGVREPIKYDNPYAFGDLKIIVNYKLNGVTMPEISTPVFVLPYREYRTYALNIYSPIYSTLEINSIEFILSGYIPYVGARGIPWFLFSNPRLEYQPEVSIGGEIRVDSNGIELYGKTNIRGALDGDFKIGNIGKRSLHEGLGHTVIDSFFRYGLESDDYPATRWYRKWSDGWIEQGGIYDSGPSSGYPDKKLTFPTPFATADTYIIVGAGAGYKSGSSSINTHVAGNIVFPREKQDGGTSVSVWTGDDDTYNQTMIYWYACGW